MEVPPTYNLYLLEIPNVVNGYISPLNIHFFVNSINRYLSFAKVVLFVDYIKIFLKINSTDDHLLLQSELDYFCNCIFSVLIFPLI